MRLSPPVNCPRYSSNKSAENWSTEITTMSLGGAATAGTAMLAASRAINLRTTFSIPSPRPQSRGLPAFHCKEKADDGSSPACRLRIQFRPQPLVDDARIGLALHRLHHLADEEAEQRLLAALVLGDLVRIRRQHFIHRCIDGAGVARLLEPPFFDDPGRGLAGFEHDLAHLLGGRGAYRLVGHA